jgi:hypothetical protein
MRKKWVGCSTMRLRRMCGQVHASLAGAGVSGAAPWELA